MTEVDETDHKQEEELKEELHEVERRDEQLADELRAGERREGELTEELHELEEHKEAEIEVSFPLASQEPYRREVPREELAGEVLKSAMAYFGVADDQTTKYELYHKGNLVALGESVGAIAEHAHEVKFTLSKELFQG
jgi:hypothetical protein